jgi:hypothetical protein
MAAAATGGPVLGVHYRSHQRDLLNVLVVSTKLFHDSGRSFAPSLAESGPT